MRNPRSIRIGFGIGLAFLAGRVQVDAATMVYTESTTASGTLGSQSFTNVPVTFTQTADAGDIALQRSNGLGANWYLADDQTSTVTIGGIGTFKLSGPTATYNFEGYGGVGGELAVGLQALNNFGTIYLGLFKQDAIAGPSIDLHDPYPPITGPILGQVGPVPTDAGTLTLTGVAPAGTFTAAVSPVPEPSSLAIAGCLAGVALAARRVGRGRGA